MFNEGQGLTIKVSGYCGFSSFDEKNFDGQLGRTKLSQTLLPITFKNSVLGCQQWAGSNATAPQQSENTIHDQPPSYEQSLSQRPPQRPPQWPPLAGGKIDDKPNWNAMMNKIEYI